MHTQRASTDVIHFPFELNFINNLVNFYFLIKKFIPFMQVLGEHFDGTGFGTRVVVCGFGGSGFGGWGFGGIGNKDVSQHLPVNSVGHSHFYFIKFSLNNF